MESLNGTFETPDTHKRTNNIPTKKFLYCFSVFDVSIPIGIDKETTGWMDAKFYQTADLKTGSVVEGIDNSENINRAWGFKDENFAGENIILYGDPNMHPGDRKSFETVSSAFREIRLNLFKAYTDGTGPMPTDELILEELIKKFGSTIYTLPQGGIEGHGTKS